MSGAVDLSCSQFKCQSTGHCIFSRYHCDGLINCFDASDELGCDVGCKAGYRCGSGECIEGKLLCDNALNCRDGSDEHNCRLSVWDDADNSLVYSTPVTSGHYRMHIDTQAAGADTVFALLMCVTGLLCIVIVILISVWHYRRQRVLMAAAARRHSGRRLISTYPTQLQATTDNPNPRTGQTLVLSYPQSQVGDNGSGGVETRSGVTLPPPYCESPLYCEAYCEAPSYCEVVDAPPPYSIADHNPNSSPPNPVPNRQ